MCFPLRQRGRLASYDFAAPLRGMWEWRHIAFCLAPLGQRIAPLGHGGPIGRGEAPGLGEPDSGIGPQADLATAPVDRDSLQP